MIITHNETIILNNETVVLIYSFRMYLVWKILYIIVIRNKINLILL